LETRRSHAYAGVSSEWGRETLAYETLIQPQQWKRKRRGGHPIKKKTILETTQEEGGGRWGVLLSQKLSMFDTAEIQAKKQQQKIERKNKRRKMGKGTTQRGALIFSNQPDSKLGNQTKTIY